MRVMRALLAFNARGRRSSWVASAWVVSASQAITVARCCGVFVAALLSGQGRALGAA
jgi:hypothetical protein